MEFYKKGFSLFELIIVLTIISIAAAIAIPSLYSLSENSTNRLNAEQLLRAINLARGEAVARHDEVVLCKNVEWQNGYMILNKNQKIFIFENRIKGQIHWRAFPIGRNDLRFLPAGFADTENGTFWYCPHADKNPVWAIAVGSSGRARLVLPNFKGNIVDDKGKELVC
jgi:type IV fimbrial biogenesis protein FimT